MDLIPVELAECVLTSPKCSFLYDIKKTPQLLHACFVKCAHINFLVPTKNAQKCGQKIAGFGSFRDLVICDCQSRSLFFGRRVGRVDLHENEHHGNDYKLSFVIAFISIRQFG